MLYAVACALTRVKGLFSYGAPPPPGYTPIHPVAQQQQPQDGVMTLPVPVTKPNDNCMYNEQCVLCFDICYSG